MPARDAPDVRHAADSPDLLADGLTEAMRQVGAHTGSVYLLAPGERILRLAVMRGLPREFASVFEQIPIRAPNPVAEALRVGGLVWAGPEDLVHRYPRIALTAPYRHAMAALPVATATATYGSMFLLWPGSRTAELSPWEREHLEAAAAALAHRLEQAARAGQPIWAGRRLPELIPSAQPAGAEELAAMATRFPEGMCALDPRGRLTFITATGAELVGALPERLVGASLWEALPWLSDPVYEDRYRAAMISQQPTSFVALRPPDRWLSFQLYPDTAGISVRITLTEVEAASGRQSTTSGPAARPSGPTRAGAIYHLMHLASALTEAVSVQDVVDLVADEILPAFGGQALVLLTAENGRLHTISHRGYAPQTVARLDRTPLTSATPGVRTLVTGIPTFFGSPQELDQAYPSLAAGHDSLAAWAFLPLVASGHAIGTCVLAFAQPHHFADQERAVLTALGGLIAQALERARLYDTEHELAQGLQAALLPHTLPRIPGLTVAARYLPGTEGMDIGGDFYDLIALDHTSAAALIGDVQGHNVNAAALMGQLRTAIRAYTTTEPGPGPVLTRANHLLTDLDTDLFASSLYLHFDLAARRVRLASAGHPQPLLRHPDGHVEALDLPPGLLLGIEPDTAYSATEIPLPPGSVLVLYTDGLVETPGIDLDHATADLGSHLARLGDQPAEDLADALIHHAQQTAHRTDDIALLLLHA